MALKDNLEFAKTWWKEAGPVARALVITALLMTVVLIGVSVGSRNEERMSPLFTRMETGDAAEVMQALQARKTPYEIEDGGKSILVPDELVYQLRLELASEGLPRGAGVGFELFDKDSLFMTDFTQRVNYTRALQGELQRTISKLPQVESARIHLALPENSLFKRNKTDASASVYLKLYVGRVLTEKQIAGITHMVSTSVEALSPEHISVLDGDGRLLSAPPADGAGGMSSRVLAAREDYQKRMEDRLLELLEPLYGHGEVMVRVNAEMNLSQIEATEEDYDADGATVVSERKSGEKASQNSQTPRGVAGTPGNLPQTATAPTTQAQSGSSSDRETTQINYVVPRTVRQISQSVSSVTRMSVAVLINGEAPKADDGSLAIGGGVENPGITDESTKIHNLVARAAGLVPERGDEVQVTWSPFVETEDVAAAPTDEVAEVEIPWLAAVLGTIIVAIALAGLVFARKRIRADLEIVMERRKEQDRMNQKVDPVDQTPTEERRRIVREEVRQVAADNIDAVRHLVKHMVATSVQN